MEEAILTLPKIAEIIRRRGFVAYTDDLSLQLASRGKQQKQEQVSRGKLRENSLTHTDRLENLVPRDEQMQRQA